MSWIEVANPGIASVQDFGRRGLQRYGVARSGAMDRSALAHANALVGSDAQSAAIEIGPLPVRLVLESGPPVRFALAGAGRRIEVSRSEIALDRTAILGAGDRLELGPARGGVYSYLTFEGGIFAQPQHGSLSVDERAGFGAPWARRLAAGDLFEVREASVWKSERSLARPQFAPGPIRVVLGPQHDYFRRNTIERFLSVPWQVAHTSSRMCCCLDGPALAHERGYNIVSDATVDGSIQIAGNGLPYVLLADRGTIGGYPKIATVITADLDRLAQLPPGSCLTFAAIDVAEAQALLRKKTQALQGARFQPVADASQGPAEVDMARLMSANVAGAATDALAAGPAD